MSMLYKNPDIHETIKDKAIQMVRANGKLTTESRANIIKAAMCLDVVCDGARTLDEQGFNGLDSKFFKPFLAKERETGDVWDSTVVEMHMKLRKYKKQLSGFGIDYDNLKLEFQSKQEVIKQDGVKPDSKNNGTKGTQKMQIQVKESWKTFEMPFGKHKGKNFAQLATEEFHYLEWIANNPEFNNPDVKAAAQAVIRNEEIGKKDSGSNDNTQISISLEGEDIKIRFPYNKELVSAVKEISGFKKFETVGNDKYWLLKRYQLDEIVAKFPNATMNDTLKQLVESRKLLESKANAMTTKTFFELAGFGNGRTLMPFQIAGLEFLEIANGRAMIADEMGTGKTCQTLAYMQLHPEQRPAIVVCPASLKYNWRNECKQWLDTDDTVQIISKGKPVEITGDIIIINYDILGKHEPELLKANPQLIVFDESHKLKNHKAQRTITATRIAGMIPHVVLLTGTPILNKPVELFSQLHILDPEEYAVTAFMPFARKFCDAKQVSIGGGRVAWDMSGASNLDLLAQKLKTKMIRRTKEQVLPELPQKRRIPFPIECDNMKKYEEQREAFKKWVIQNRGKDSANLDILPQIEYLKQMTVEGKLKAGIDFIKDTFIANETKVLIFCTHKDTINTLEEAFKEICVKVDGSVKDIDRQAARDQFQNDPSTLVFLGNIKAASEGLTLTAASNVVFFEFDWTPAAHDQAEDRTHRIGQTAFSVNCYYLIAEGTIDEFIMGMLETKRKIAQGGVGDKKELHFNLFENITSYLNIPPTPLNLLHDAITSE